MRSVQITCLGVTRKAQWGKGEKRVPTVAKQPEKRGVIKWIKFTLSLRGGLTKGERDKNTKNLSILKTKFP